MRQDYPGPDGRGPGLRVLLINPALSVSEKDFWGDMAYPPPLGLAYLAGAVSRAGHEVEIIDCLGLYPIPVEHNEGRVRIGMRADDILARASEFKPDITGIACGYTAHAPDSIGVAVKIKECLGSGHPVIMGGAHATTCPEDVFSSGVVDYIAMGEGEGILTDLCGSLERGEPTGPIEGLLAMSPDGTVTGIRQRARIQDLDSLALPRRDLLPMDVYFKYQTLRKDRINFMRRPQTTMITSRGCPEKCVFCALRCTWGRKWVPRSAESVVDEVQMLVDDYGVREIHFMDDSISVHRERLKKICELIIERKIDFRWQPASGIAIWTLDAELLKLMKKSGCYRLTLGVESGNAETLAFIRKRYTHEHALEIIKEANRLGMWTIGTFILGFPYETREQMEDSVRFSIDSGLDFAFFYCAAPFPGTDLFDIYVKEGIEVPPETTVAFGLVDSLTMEACEIEAAREDATARFMRNISHRPWKMLGKIRSLEDVGYVLKVASYGLKLARTRTEDKSISAYLYGDD